MAHGGTLCRVGKRAGNAPVNDREPRPDQGRGSRLVGSPLRGPVLAGQLRGIGHRKTTGLVRVVTLPAWSVARMRSNPGTRRSRLSRARSFALGRSASVTTRR